MKNFKLQSMSRISLFLIIILFFITCYSCNYNSKTISFYDIKGIWTVQSIRINSIEHVDSLVTKNVSFISQDKTFIPLFKGNLLRHRKCNSKLIEKNMMIYLEDCQQDLLTGEYKMLMKVNEIEKLLELKNSNITIELKKIRGNLRDGIPTNFGKK